MTMTALANEVQIEARTVGSGRPCFVVAEIGVNHNGDPEIAHRMIDAIADAGADSVKFQTFSADEFVGDPNETYEYESQGRRVRESMLDMFRRLELRRYEFAALFSHARERKLIPLSTGADRAAIDLLDSLGAGAFKIGSDDLVYTPFLDYVARKGKPVILSTGMAGAADVVRAVDAVGAAGNRRIVLLHCVSLYPTPDESVNLRKIAALRDMFRCPVGFSDHSFGITAALGAVALGAVALEKHFTLDRNMPGPDHRFSADPAELASLVRETRRLERNLGDAGLKPAPGEADMARLAHRSIVARVDLAEGHAIREDDLAFRRPGTGLKPFEMERLIGRRLRRAVAANTQLAYEMFDDR